MALSADSLAALNSRIVACDRCTRLRAYCAQVASVRRRAYVDQEYWGKPVPSFGDQQARVLVLGLAPGAHGSNRTGRPFTGDGSGDFLYPVLHESGFASQARAVSRDDGMKLTGLWISAVVRCAPPENKPTPEEQRNCAPWLDEEIRLLASLRVVVCLGQDCIRWISEASAPRWAHCGAGGISIPPWRGVCSPGWAAPVGELSSIAAEHQYW